MDVTFLIMGSMVGSGIFFLPGSMLAQSGTVLLVLGAMLVGAVAALCGSLLFAELGAAFPKAGGQYAFLRDGLSRQAGFLFSWTGFTVVQSGTIAAVAIALAGAVDFLAGGALPGHVVCAGTDSPVGCLGLPIPKWSVGFLAVGVVWLLTGLNALGVRRAAHVNNVATVAKLLALGFVIACSFLLARGGNLSGAVGSATVAGFGLASANILFAYDGFAQATFVAAEVKDPRRVLPRAILTAISLVTVVYLLAAVAYFWVLPAGDVSSASLSGSQPIAAQALQALFPIGAALVASGILVSTFGTVNAYVLASPRIYAGAAEGGEFPKPFARRNRFGEPGYGLWVQGLWASLLVMSGSYLTLTNLVVFGLYVFYLFTVVAYFRLRRRHPDAFDAFQMPLRPAPALLFAAIAVGVLGFLAYNDVDVFQKTHSVAGLLLSTSVLALLLIGSGALAYRLGGATTSSGKGQVEPK
jgi:APA family basic amino acid/polyamine antiporter